jgi:hypothetical protein
MFHIRTFDSNHTGDAVCVARCQCCERLAESDRSIVGATSRCRAFVLVIALLCECACVDARTQISLDVTRTFPDVVAFHSNFEIRLVM